MYWLTTYGVFYIGEEAKRLPDGRVCYKHVAGGPSCSGGLTDDNLFMADKNPPWEATHVVIYRIESHYYYRFVQLDEITKKTRTLEQWENGETGVFEQLPDERWSCSNPAIDAFEIKTLDEFIPPPVFWDVPYVITVKGTLQVAARTEGEAIRFAKSGFRSKERTETSGEPEFGVPQKAPVSNT